jgi:hypothetical protein
MKFILGKVALVLVGALALTVTSVFVVTSKITSSSAANPSDSGFVAKSICGKDGKSECGQGAVGPGGGTIFFVDYHNAYPTFDYLEVAPSTWAGPLGVDPNSAWCSDIKNKIEVNLNAWSSRAVGLGTPNTKLMLGVCKSGAANLIADYNASSRSIKKDWFLPTIGCLLEMDNALQGLAGLIDGNYWSSSGASATGAWVQAMGHGYQGTATKDSMYHVRPVRAF